MQKFENWHVQILVPIASELQASAVATVATTAAAAGAAAAAQP